MPPKPSQNRLTRIPFLDGWRAVSVFCVMLGHGLGALNIERSGLPDLAKMGVYIFFAISGYVIMRTSIAERERTGQFSHQNFVLRRAYRILPPLVLYVAFVAISAAGEAYNWTAPFRALSFTCNMDLPIGSCGFLFGHTWSLSFEEQFYLLFPFVFLRKTSFLAALALIFALMPLVFDVQWLGALTYFHALMLLTLGCMYAAFQNKVDGALSRIPTALIILVSLLAIGWFGLGLGHLRTLTAVIVPFAILLLTFELPKRIGTLKAVLSWWPLTQLGLYSYSIYLWQQYFLTPGSASSWYSVAASMLLVTVLAGISYHTFEAYFRNLSRKLA
jgi:peptidoglycan/LPS O-acetylase OafA/YrhL